MKKLSLVMIVKNEEKVLERCLNSCKNIVDEIIIVDTGSTDNTKNIAKKFNAKIYDYTWDNNFSNARNFAISKSTGDFNLILDADEYITKFNKNSFINFMENPNKQIGKIKIINFFKKDNKIMKDNTFISRLIPKNIFYEGMVHEQINSNLPRIIVDIEIEHDGYMYIIVS